MALVDLNGVEAQSGNFDLIPDGVYTFLVNDSKLKSTKSGSGKFIEITMQCIDDAFKNRKVWHRFNIENTSVKAESIGKQQLKTFLECAGMDSAVLDDVEDLISLEVKAKITTEHTPPYNAQNVVKGWLPGSAVKKPAEEKESLGF